MKVILICSSIGIVHRGYEKAVSDLYQKLKTHTTWDVKLIKGAGPETENEITIGAPKIPKWAANLLAMLRRRPLAWVFDNLYAKKALPTLIAEDPDLVYYMEVFLGNALMHRRNKKNLRFKLLFANGALLEPSLNQFDHAQQLLPFYKQAAVEAGVAATKQTVLPHGMDIEANFNPISADEKKELRQKHKLPTERHILLNVGAINYGHKRTDYVINEVANIPESQRPFLLILGHIEPDSQRIIELAEKKLGNENFRAGTVPGNQIMDFYHLSDSFVLGSLFEGQPLVITEALTAGLPIFAHKYKVTDHVGGPMMMRGDLSQTGTLTNLFIDFLKQGSPATPAQLHAFAYQTFSWDVLLPKYIEMLETAASIKN